MRTQIPAFLERAFPRAFSAVLMLLLAGLTSPTWVGIYSMISLMYSGIQAGTDSAVRQVLMRAVTEPEGATFLRWYRTLAPAIALVCIGGLIVVLRFMGVIPSWAVAAELSPMAFAPIFPALGIKALGTLQLEGRWMALARGQFWASVLSVGLAIPLLLKTHNLLAPALQTLLAEALMTAYCIYQVHAKKQTTPVTEVPAVTHEKTIAGDMASMSVYALLSFAQGQAERILLGGLAGASVLGSYSTASAVGRAAGDSLAASTANVTRAAVVSHSDPKDIRDATEHALSRTLILAFGAAVASTVLALVLRPLLGPQWYTALAIVPILAISSFPSALAWTGSVLQVRVGRGWTALWAPLVGTGLAVGIAFAAAHSLVVAAYLVVARDLIVATIAFVTVRDCAPWRAYRMCCIAIAVLGPLAYLLT